MRKSFPAKPGRKFLDEKRRGFACCMRKVVRFHQMVAGAGGWISEKSALCVGGPGIRRGSGGAGTAGAGRIRGQGGKAGFPGSGQHSYQRTPLAVAHVQGPESVQQPAVWSCEHADGGMRTHGGWMAEAGGVTFGAVPSFRLPELSLATAREAPLCDSKSGTSFLRAALQRRFAS
jgi:hypothetical protein